MEKQIKKLNPNVDIKISDEMSGFDDDGPYKLTAIHVTIEDEKYK